MTAPEEISCFSLIYYILGIFLTIQDLKGTEDGPWLNYNNIWFQSPERFSQTFILQIQIV